MMGGSSMTAPSPLQTACCIEHQIWCDASPTQVVILLGRYGAEASSEKEVQTTPVLNRVRGE